jgi:hypothetical protein
LSVRSPSDPGSHSEARESPVSSSRIRTPINAGEDPGHEAGVYEIFEDALRRYLEEPGGAEASREETVGNGTHERQPRPRIPLLSGGQDPTLGERFEEELYPS